MSSSARMLDMLRELTAHKGYSDSVVLAAVRDTPGAATDVEILELLHHVVLANRFWLASIQSRPFAIDVEARRPESLDDIAHRYAVTHQAESAWLVDAQEHDLARTLESALIPGGRCSVGQAWMQVCMHSHGHRAQCAKLLRRHGGAPPAIDFMTWLPSREAASWPTTR